MEKALEDSPFKAPQANLEQSEAPTGPFKLNIFFPGGRLGRMRYFTFSYALMAVLGILVAITIPAFAKAGATTSAAIPAVLMGFLWMYLGIMLAVKRLHDINASGLWLLLPVALVILLMVTGGLSAKNSGASTVMGMLITGAYSLTCLIMGIVLVFVPGTKGENRFGYPTPPNSTGVKIGFFIILGLIALGIITMINAGYQYGQYINRGL